MLKALKLKLYSRKLFNMFHSDVWCCIIPHLEIDDWLNTSLVCKSANSGLNKYMNIRYGNVNTFANDVPLRVHIWRCRSNNPPMIEHIWYPNAFEDPSSTLPKPYIIKHSEYDNTPFITDLSHIDFGKEYEFSTRSYDYEEYISEEDEVSEEE